MSKLCITAGTIAATLSLLSAVRPTHAQTTPSNRTPVLVELFTSEGCSSCPPADALLAKLDHDQPIQNAEIIVLGEHVDYWESVHWHDRFASSQYTDRQKLYGQRLRFDEVYTPQMVVDGSNQFVGNDAAHAVRAITQAAQTPKLPLSLARPVVDGRRISSSVSAPPTESHGDLYAALVDISDTTEVRGGENGGRRLQHAGVVRNLQKIGNLKDLGTKPLAFTLKSPGDANLAAMRVVVFAQQNGQGNILGAVTTSITP
jgi:hypothetical protein